MSYNNEINYLIIILDNETKSLVNNNYDIFENFKREYTLFIKLLYDRLKEEDGSYIINGCRFYHDEYKYFARVYGDISREFVTNLFEKYDYSKNVSRIEYDITHDTFGELYVENHPVTVEDKKLVIKKLEEYIKIAEEIVKKNTMSKSNNGIAITKRKK